MQSSAIQIIVYDIYYQNAITLFIIMLLSIFSCINYSTIK